MERDRQTQQRLIFNFLLLNNERDDIKTRQNSDIYLEPALYCIVSVRFDVKVWVSDRRK